MEVYRKNTIFFYSIKRTWGVIKAIVNSHKFCFSTRFIRSLFTSLCISLHQKTQNHCYFQPSFAKLTVRLLHCILRSTGSFRQNYWQSDSCMQPIGCELWTRYRHYVKRLWNPTFILVCSENPRFFYFVWFHIFFQWPFQSYTPENWVVLFYKTFKDWLFKYFSSRCCQKKKSYFAPWFDVSDGVQSHAHASEFKAW